MTDLDRATRAAIRDAQDLYGNAINHISKALDALYQEEYLVRGLGGSYWRRTETAIRNAHELWVDLGMLSSAIGEATPDD